jgi:hypothetical protein
MYLAYAYFRHHKCATQWIKGILNEVCAELALRPSTFNSPREFGLDLPAALRTNPTDFLCYLNASADHVSGLSGYRGFHVVRDPRDITVSAYFSHKFSHPLPKHGPAASWLNEDYRRMLQEVDEQTGLMMVLERRASQFHQMLKWDYGQPHIKEVRFEHLTADPASEFRHIFHHLGLLDPVSPTNRAHLTGELLDTILSRHTFTIKSHGRKPGEEDPMAHYRKGKPGDWKAHFTPKHIAHFKERYNDLLVALGYEQKTDW